MNGKLKNNFESLLIVQFRLFLFMSCYGLSKKSSPNDILKLKAVVLNQKWNWSRTSSATVKKKENKQVKDIKQHYLFVHSLQNHVISTLSFKLQKKTFKANLKLKSHNSGSEAKAVWKMSKGFFRNSMEIGTTQDTFSKLKKVFLLEENSKCALLYCTFLLDFYWFAVNKRA
jgi:hypothetical protein